LILKEKVLLETSNKVAMGPNGGGGMFSGLYRHEIIKHMKDKGVSHLHVYGVDNVLC